MLPSILARQYQEGLIDYIDTSFPITNSIFKDSLRNMLNTKDSVFHAARDMIVVDIYIYRMNRIWIFMEKFIVRAN